MIPGERTLSLESGKLSWSFKVVALAQPDGVHAALMCDDNLALTEDPRRMTWLGPYPDEDAAIAAVKSRFKGMVDTQIVAVQRALKRRKLP